MRALIVEDEPLMADELEEQLLDENFVVDLSDTFRNAKNNIIAEEYDLILLDLSLPDGDGLDLLRFIKRLSDETAVIILTARGEIEDKVTGLELGSDDYLAKPFSMAELRARIHAVLRRKFKINENEILAGKIVLTLDQLGVFYDGKAMDFTETEYKVLRYLMLNKNKTITRISLAEHIWGSKVDDRFSLEFINSHMKNIRQKLSKVQADHHIETVYGVGYKLVEDETQ
ncbi:MAG: response regulator transcription factor [Balneolaceae bacterium]|nr:response regulator transcription factor [Balneolaceae bacterium]MDR9407853.1 response regulator transcription factor [Balneolaceae bacterium]